MTHLTDMTDHPSHESFRARTLPALILSLLLPVALGTGAAVGLGGCNTVEGAGEDIEAGGGAIDEAADDD